MHRERNILAPFGYQAARKVTHYLVYFLRYESFLRSNGKCAKKEGEGWQVMVGIRVFCFCSVFCTLITNTFQASGWHSNTGEYPQFFVARVLLQTAHVQCMNYILSIKAGSFASRYTSKGGRNIFVPHSVCECEVKSLMGWFRGCQVQGIDWGCKRWQKLPSFSEERQSLWKNCVILAITKNACRLSAYLHCYLHPHHPCHHHQEQQHQHQHSNPLNVTKSRAGAAGCATVVLWLVVLLTVLVCILVCGSVCSGAIEG